MLYRKRITDLREDNDLTQQNIAAILRVSQSTYNEYEHGRTRLPIEHLITLARYYKVPTDYILGLTNTTTPYP